MRDSRIFEQYSDNASFLNAARQAVKSFAYDRRKGANRSEILKVANHAGEIVVKESKKDWRPFKSSHVALEGYEAPAVGLMSFVLRKFSIVNFFDVGAASGLFSFIAAGTESKKITAHAFEMSPQPFQKMLGKIAQNSALPGEIHAHLAGLSDRHEGQRDIWFSRTQMYETEPSPSAYREAWHRRLKFALSGVRERDELKSASVLLTSIDAFSEGYGSPQFIKIDVDGYEGKVLQGAEKTLRAERPFVLLELHQDDHIDRTGWSRSTIAKYLFDIGYSAACLTNHYNVKKTELVEVEFGDRVFAQQKTTMFLFF